MPRPSGMRHRPRRARSSGRAPLTRRPATSTSPAVAPSRPATTLQRRRLARAVRAEQRDDAGRGGRRGRRRAAPRCRRSRPGCRAARAAARPSVSSTGTARHDAAVLAGAEVGGEHGLVVLDRRAVSPSAMIRPKSSTWTWSHTSITSGTSCSTSTTAHALVGELDEQLAEALGLVVVLARCRLVEQQHLRLAGERPAELDQPALPGGERRRPGRRRRRRARPAR